VRLLAAADRLAKPPLILHTAAHTCCEFKNKPESAASGDVAWNCCSMPFCRPSARGFYAAVTVGVSISFGILDIVNIAHPAFIILGSYIAYIVKPRRWGLIRS